MIIAAFPMMGIFQYFIFIPVIPEMLERIQGDFGIIEGENPDLDNAVNDKVNDAYGLVYAFSNFVSPLAGSIVASTYDRSIAGDIWAFTNFGLAVILFLFNCGIFVFSEHREFQKKLEALKASADLNYGMDTTGNEKDIKKNRRSLSANVAGTSYKDNLTARPKIGALAFLERQNSTNVSNMQKMVV